MSIEINGAGVITGVDSLSTPAVTNAAGSASAPSITFTGDPNTGLYSPGADQVALTTGGTARLYIDSSGRVGIGTTSPESLVHINGDATALRITRGSAIGFAYNTGTASTDPFRVQSNGGPLDLYSGTGQPITFSAATSEKARIDSSGRLLVGTSSARANMFNSIATSTLGIEAVAATTGAGRISVVYNDNSPDGSSIIIGKSRATSVGGSTVVQSGDALGGISWQGADGTELVEAASIRTEVDGTPGANDMPGRLVFSTTADGASSPTERVRISQAGVVTVKNGAVAEIGTLTDAATITPDFAANCNFTVTLGGSRTIANPSNLTAGQSGSIFLVQDATGSRTVSWGSYWDFAGGTAPTLTTTANAIDRVDYIVRSSTSIHTVFTANYS